MDAVTTGPSIDILLVEDNLGEARLMQEAMNQGRVHSRIHHVRDGVLALDFLHHRPPYVNEPMPDVIILDLNMPRKDGREVLAEIKSDPWLRLLPVLVLTTSHADQDILHTYKLGVNSFIVKPVEFDKFMELIRVIEEFFAIVKSPKDWPMRRDEIMRRGDLATAPSRPAAAPGRPAPAPVRPAAAPARPGRSMLWSR